jgi:hypothetical protein
VLTGVRSVFDMALLSSPELTCSVNHSVSHSISRCAVIAYRRDLDVLRLDAADLNQYSRLEVDAASHIVLDAIAVLLRRESGCRPLAGIDTQPRTLDVLVIDDPLAVAGRDVVAARVVRNFDDFTRPAFVLGPVDSPP